MGLQQLQRHTNDIITTAQVFVNVTKVTQKSGSSGMRVFVVCCVSRRERERAPHDGRQASFDAADALQTSLLHGRGASASPGPTSKGLPLWLSRPALSR